MGQVMEYCLHFIIFARPFLIELFLKTSTNILSVASFGHSFLTLPQQYVRRAMTNLIRKHFMRPAPAQEIIYARVVQHGTT